MSEIWVKKRSGAKEQLDINKINKVLQFATDGIKGVNISDIIINAKLNIYNNISTKSIQQVLIESAASLLTEDAPNYQWVAARLLNYVIRKDVWGSATPVNFYSFIKNNVKKGRYDGDILKYYTEEEINYFGEQLKHERDFKFTYAGLKQFVSKYAVQNRKTKEIFETPQYAFMLVSMVALMKYEPEVRKQYVVDAYDAFSLFKINLPTPQIAGIRTHLKSYSSCCLINVADDMDSISTASHLIYDATADRFGIGVNMGNVRAIGSEIRGGEVISTGVIPFLKAQEGIVKSCQQNGIRGGGGTMNFPLFHYEIEDILQLKNNGGTETNRVRHLDYVIHISKLFYERLQKQENITLFSYHEAPEVFDSFGMPEFDDLYVKAEQNPKIKMKKVVPAVELFTLLIKERLETGRIYILHIDHVNSHGSWNQKIDMTNLCVEVTFPTIPLLNYNDPNGEIGICVLSAVNMLEITDDDDLKKTCNLIVRILDELIDYQEYFHPAADKFIRNKRAIGVGLTNLAGYLATNGYKYSDPQTPNVVAKFTEAFQYYLIDASAELASEKGVCEHYNQTKYSLGIFPIDTYKKSIDAFITEPLHKNWDSLRLKVAKFGLRNCTLSCQMPCESSSILQNATNGIEPVKSLLTYKNSKTASLPMLVPNYEKHKNDYELAFDISNKKLYNIYAAEGKFIDMSISANSYHRYLDYEDGKIPDQVLLTDALYAYKVGVKSLYYALSDDNVDVEEDCASGACAI